MSKNSKNKLPSQSGNTTEGEDLSLGKPQSFIKQFFGLGNEDIISLLKTCVLFAAIAIFLKGSVVEAFKIPSASMKPTLIIHDHILVNKLSYGLHLPFVKETLYQYSEPDRGDVVVFTKSDDEMTSYTDESDINIIKRVVGLPGEKIEVRGTNVYINDQRYNADDEYSVWVAGGQTDFGPVVVPDGHVLVLGDNRDQSKDSRAWERGPFLPITRIKGRAFIIYFNRSFISDRIFRIIR